jgi:hypothetical protein
MYAPWNVVSNLSNRPAMRLGIFILYKSNL